MNILVTGALGHIGSGFIHNLKSGDFEKVILLDNLLTMRYCSLFNLPEDVGFQFVEGDILECDLESLITQVDAVVHLAAITDAANSFDNRELVMKVNLDGTRRVAETCAYLHKPIIFPSTTSVYGVQEDLVDENCPIEDLKPQSPYADSKLQAEQILADLGRRKGLRYVVFRLGTIFGMSIGMRFHTAVNKFVWQACNGLTLSVWRSALNQKRPYLDLGDAIHAFRFVLEKNLFCNEIFNVVTENHTVAEIVDVIKEYVPDTRMEFVDARIMNQLSYEVSTRKFESAGFTYHGSLNAAIGDTVRLLKNLRRENHTAGVDQ